MTLDLWISALQMGCFFGLLALAYYLVLVGAGFFNFAIGPYAMVSGLFTSYLVIEEEVDALACDLTIRRSEGFGQDEFARQAKHIVDQPRASLRRIFLDRKHCREVSPAGPGGFECIKPEADPLVGQMMAEVGAFRRQQNRP